MLGSLGTPYESYGSWSGTHAGSAGCAPVGVGCSGARSGSAFLRQGLGFRVESSFLACGFFSKLWAPVGFCVYIHIYIYICICIYTYIFIYLYVYILAAPNIQGYQNKMGP